MVRPSLSADVLKALAGKRLATAESLTGGGIGAAITSVSGASAVFAGGVISYTNEVKNQVLGVPMEVLNAERKLDRQALIEEALASVEKISVIYGETEPFC